MAKSLVSLVLPAVVSLGICSSVLFESLVQAQAKKVVTSLEKLPRSSFVVVTSHLTAELFFTQKIKRKMVQWCFSARLIFPSVLSAAHNTDNFKTIATGVHWQSKCINYIDSPNCQHSFLSHCCSVNLFEMIFQAGAERLQAPWVWLCSVLQISALNSVTAVNEAFYFYFTDHTGGNKFWSACQITSIYSD